MWSLVCYILLRKTYHRHRRGSDENFRNTSDNWKVNQVRKSPIVSHIQPIHGFNTELSLFTSKTHRVFD